MDTIAHIAARANHIGPRCGEVTVIVIDGPAGSGKTTLAGRLATALGAQTLAMDDLYPGWGGLRAGGTLVGHVLDALSRGETAQYRRYDWHAAQYLESHEILPHGVLIVEGVGSLRLEYRELLSLIVVVHEADANERLRRGLARDGVGARKDWLAWMQAEQELHQEVALAANADIVVDGTGRIQR